MSRPIKHGHGSNRGVRDKTYNSWMSMKGRCKNPSRKYYAQKGITVCPRWNNFENFLNDMGERPEGKTLDRIDGNGNYEPTNCRWSTYTEQSRHSRMFSEIEVEAIRKMRDEGFTLLAIARQFGCSDPTIFKICRGDVYRE